MNLKQRFDTVKQNLKKSDPFKEFRGLQQHSQLENITKSKAKLFLVVNGPIMDLLWFIAIIFLSYLLGYNKNLFELYLIYLIPALIVLPITLNIIRKANIELEDDETKPYDVVRKTSVKLLLLAAPLLISMAVIVLKIIGDTI